MRGSTKRYIFAGLLLVWVVLVVMMVVERRAAPANAVVLQQNASRTIVDSLLSFDLVNNGDVPIMCPDSWFLEFEDGSTTNLSLFPAGDVRVPPGSTGTISFPRPATTNRWRLRASYYDEGVVFEVKVQLDQSSLKQHLPSGATRVRGKTTSSEWINGTGGPGNS
jgi:hypothetical protein